MTVSIESATVPLSVLIHNDFPDSDSKVHALRAVGYLVTDSVQRAEIDTRIADPGSMSGQEFAVPLAPDTTIVAAQMMLKGAEITII